MSSMSSLLDPNNRLFALARSGQRLPGWLLTLTMCQVFLFVGGLPAALIILRLVQIELDVSPALPLEQTLLQFIGAPAVQVTMLVLGFGPINLLIWAWLAWYERRPFWTLGFERAGAATKFLRGMLVGAGMFSAAVVLMTLTDSVTLAPVDRQGQEVSALATPLLMFLAWAVQGPSEEVLTRGWLMPVIGARYRPYYGVLASALVFALLHAINLGFTWLALLNLVLIAVFLSLFVLWEGGLWGACGFHATWNWVQGNVFGFEVSGTAPAGGMWLNVETTGPPAVTGGAFGPEGGLATTVVISIAIVGVIVLSRRQRLAAATKASEAG